MRVIFRTAVGYIESVCAASFNSGVHLSLFAPLSVGSTSHTESHAAARAAYARSAHARLRGSHGTLGRHPAFAHDKRKFHRWPNPYRSSGNVAQ